MKYPSLTVDDDASLEIRNISQGVFNPLKGFLNARDYRSVVDDMHLCDGSPWTVPVTLALSDDERKNLKGHDRIRLLDKTGNKLATLVVDDVYEIDVVHDAVKVFGTDEAAHPGVTKELARSRIRVGGILTEFCPEKARTGVARYALSPDETKNIFKHNGWQTVTGFQTRNPVHRAHEYLHRIAMEVTDGVFLQPLVGWKKSGDISPEAVLAAYECMTKNFYPANRAVLGCLMTPMRYAGPREAVFHALIRRNYGCTHFIVGRDHAGVGGYYGKYEAQELCRRFDDLGIEILALCGPYYCSRCETVVTEKTCRHGETYAVSVSGTEVRRMIREGKLPPEEFMRPEIADVLAEFDQRGELFVE